MNPTIGTLNCPICKAVGRTTQATVHREGKGKKALYFRCSCCGTIQPRMRQGQQAIELLMKPIPGQGQDKVGEKATKPAQEQNSSPKGKGGLLGMLWSSED